MNPFEPLSSAEIEKAVATFRNARPEQPAYFSSSGLVEPAKERVKAGESGARVVRLMGVDDQADGGFMADVDVTAGAVVEVQGWVLRRRGHTGLRNWGLR